MGSEIQLRIELMTRNDYTIFHSVHMTKKYKHQCELWDGKIASIEVRMLTAIHLPELWNKLSNERQALLLSYPDPPVSKRLRAKDENAMALQLAFPTVKK